MDYLKNFLNVNGTIDSLQDGLVFIRSVLHLDLASAEVDDINADNKETDRKGNLNAGSFKPNDDVKKRIYSLLGETFKDRKQTKVLSHGTVFGGDNKVSLDFSEHSHYGMNPAYLNDVGVPNPAAISKRLREIVVSTELKEQRLNNYINSIVVSDFYDNATSLLYVMLQKMNILKMMDKMNSYTHIYTLRARQVLALTKGGENERFNKLREFIMDGTFKMSVSEHDTELYSMCDSMKEWAASLPSETIEGENGSRLPNPNFENLIYKLEVKYWKMYDYNDGHSRSGTHFGDVVGMCHNRYKIPREWDDTASYTTTRPSLHNMNMPTSEDSINSLGRAKYYINCTSLSDTDLTLLAVCLEGNRRSTPFLVDQDIDFGHDDRTKIYFLRPGNTEMVLPDFRFTVKDIQGLITKLVVTHKWYEELRAASVAMKYWLVQPATETVESHWWLNTKRTLSLPYLGLRRAILPMLLDGDGVNIHKESLLLTKELVSNKHSTWFESMLANTTWFWGEYLNQYNSKNLPSLFHKFDNDYFDTIPPLERADALSSAILGVAVPRPIFNLIGTYFTKGLRSHYKDTILFGDIKISHPEEYGYSINENSRLNTNGLVCPSGTGLITGLGGSLLNGTPYHAVFEINRSVMRNRRSKSEQAFHYYDLWAYGVVQRWQGYDVSYLHPKNNGKHKIYAANNVSVAMPPVNPLSMDEVLPYIVLQDTEREYGFGSSIEWLRGYHSYFTWQRSRVEALRCPDYNAMPVVPDNRSMYSVDRILTTSQKAGNKQSLIYSTYDIESSDFQISYPEIAVPLEVGAGRLQLEEIDTGTIQRESDPPDMSTQNL